MDLECLWGSFKPFGKVRDVYLSFNKVSRRSKFAFVRFESLEEATNMAKTTNGMHIYSWPISTKVASQDWKNRRTRKDKQSFSFQEDNRQFRPEEGGYRAEHMREEPGAKRSFAEAVRGSQRAGFGHEDEEREKMKSMHWDFSQNDKDWLKKCAIGILKGFKEVSRVNDRLESFGCKFFCVSW